MKYIYHKFCLFLVFLLVQAVQAQVVTWSPAFPVHNAPITITFDATKGSGGLANQGPPVYAHTGVLTNLSSSDADWRYVKANWTTNTPEALMQSIGNNLYQITLTPRSYYNVPSSEEIKALMFVFRNANGSKEGKDTGGKDIKINIYPSGAINVAFAQPSVGINGLFVDMNQSVSVKANASASAKLSLFVNGNKVKEEASATTLETQVIATTPGANKVKFIAENGNTTATDSFTFVVRSATQTQALPANAKDGVTYLGATSVLFNVFAPNKQNAFVVGDFNNWTVGATPMKRTPDGTRYWAQVDNLTPGQEYAYQYLVDETIRIGDSYTQKTLDPNEDRFISAEVYPNLKAYPTGKASGMVSVLQTNQPTYTWKVNNFTRPKKTDLVVYELLVRDFIEKHDYKTLTDTLNYLSRLGVNTIELLPIQEFEGNLSWGYNPVYYFAPDKYYGTKQMLKAFIDEAHARGMAVILDIALNHSYGQSPMVQLYYNSATGKTTPENPWFNPDPKHEANVGHDFNHESAATKYFVDRVTEFWLQEYKIDGYRFDLSKGFTQKQTLGSYDAWAQYDQSRIDLLKRMANHIWSVDNSAFVILEHFANNDEEIVLSNHGMMLWGNMHTNYKQAILGYTSNANFNGISYKQRGWNNPNLIGYMESHDEQRQLFEAINYGNSSGSYSIKNLPTALQRMQQAAAFFFTIPGPKMIWQFGELGYDVSIDENGRTGNKPILWNYYQNEERRKLYNVYSALIKLRINQPAFESPNFTLNLSADMKTVHIQDPDMNVAVLGNFSVSVGTIDPKFQHTGTWYDFVTGEALTVTNVNQSITLQPGEYRLYTTKRLTNGSILTSSKGEVEALAKKVSVYPNPILGGAFTVQYQLEKSADVTLEVFDQTGRLQIKHTEGKQAAGTHTLTQRLVSESGSVVTPGLYLCKLTTGTSVKILKIVVQ